MMVKSIYTLVTDIAVTGVCSADDLTLRAEQIRLKFLDKTDERNLWFTLHVARADFVGQSEEDHCTCEYHEHDWEPSSSVDVWIDKDHVKKEGTYHHN